MKAPVPDNVLHAVKLARHFLADAQFRLDYRGFRCPALDDLHADIAALLSEWAGRRRPNANRGSHDSPTSENVAKAAIEYRHTRDRRERGRRAA